MEPTTNVSREQTRTASASPQPGIINEGTAPRLESARTTPPKEASEVVDQAKHAITDAYDRTSRTVQNGYKQAVDYGRENPTKAMLIVFGAGIGAGLLLANTTKNAPRDRTSRIVPTVANAVADVVTQIFR
jgi:ElaB/YqjD/DUF883 family membrane-anchored ribosome-binding protein